MSDGQGPRLNPEGVEVGGVIAARGADTSAPSLADARDRAEPVVPMLRLIDPRAAPPAPIRGARANIQVRHEVIWAEAPSPPSEKKQRLGATVHSEVMHRAPAPRPPVQGIASIQPPGRG
jgi:hypothetical protein